MSRCWIGVTTYRREREGRERFTVPAAYVDAVRAVGCVPVLLSPGEAIAQRAAGAARRPRALWRRGSRPAVLGSGEPPRGVRHVCRARCLRDCARARGDRARRPHARDLSGSANPERRARRDTSRPSPRRRWRERSASRQPARSGGAPGAHRTRFRARGDGSRRIAWRACRPGTTRRSIASGRGSPRSRGRPTAWWKPSSSRVRLRSRRCSGTPSWTWRPGAPADGFSRGSSADSPIQAPPRPTDA